MFTTRRTLSRRCGTVRTRCNIRNEAARRRMLNGYYYENDNDSDELVLEEEERNQIIQNIDEIIAELRTL